MIIKMKNEKKKFMFYIFKTYNPGPLEKDNIFSYMQFREKLHWKYIYCILKTHVKVFPTDITLLRQVISVQILPEFEFLLKII